MTATLTRPAPSPRLTRWLFVYAGWFTVVAAAALGRAAYLRGEPYIPSQGDEWTASIDIWPGALGWFALPVMYTAILGRLIAVCLLVAGIARLMDPAVRADRRAWRWLLAGTVLVGVTVLLAFSGPGDSVVNWIID